MIRIAKTEIINAICETAEEREEIINKYFEQKYYISRQGMKQFKGKEYYEIIMRKIIGVENNDTKE